MQQGQESNGILYYQLFWIQQIQAIAFTSHFSSPHEPIGPVCVDMRMMTFLSKWLVTKICGMQDRLDILWVKSEGKFIGQSSRSQQDKCYKK